MNIFATDPDPKESARVLDNQRLVKMVLETAQIMCSSLYVRGVSHTKLPYRPTHKSHPAILWAAEHPGNLRWLYLHGKALSKEYARRYNKLHKSGEVILSLKGYTTALQHPPVSFYNGARHVGLGIDFTHLPVHEAYRQYLITRWRIQKSPPRWTNRSPPDWVHYIV